MPRYRGNMGNAVHARALGEHACRRQPRGVLGWDFAMKDALGQRFSLRDFTGSDSPCGALSGGITLQDFAGR